MRTMQQTCEKKLKEIKKPTITTVTELITKNQNEYFEHPFTCHSPDKYNNN
jgi:hypothetical protein